VLHLGKIRQVQKAGIVVPDVLQAGGHWAWPDPIDKVIRLPAGERSLEVRAFCYDDEARYTRSGQKAIPKTLIPGLDGYCVTGDLNIFHTSWNIHYRIDSPVDYLLATNGEQPDAVLESLLSRAVVRTAGERTIDDAFLADVEGFRTTVEQRFRELADRLRLGIHVSKVNLVVKSEPRQTSEAFLAATDAGNRKRLMEDEAKSEANRMRQNAGAEKARVVAEATAYRTRIVLEAQADANTFQQLLPKFRQDPDGLRQQLFIEAMSEVMAKAKERFVFSPETERRRVVRIELDSQSQRRPKEKQPKGENE